MLQEEESSSSDTVSLRDIIDVQADVGQDYEVLLDEWTEYGMKL
jgi:hypothetical protein